MHFQICAFLHIVLKILSTIVGSGKFSNKAKFEKFQQISQLIELTQILSKYLWRHLIQMVKIFPWLLTALNTKKLNWLFCSKANACKNEGLKGSRKFLKYCNLLQFSARISECIGYQWSKVVRLIASNLRTTKNRNSYNSEHRITISALENSILC